MSPRPDVSAQRIPQILGAAYTVFARRGVAAATVSEVAREAGVSSALVFRYFTTKDELLLAFVGHYFAQLQTQLDLHAASGAPLRTIIASWCDELAAELETPAAQAIGQELLALSARHSDMQQVVAQAYANYRTRLAALIAAAMKRREIRKTDPEALAATLIAMIEGTNVLQLATGGRGLAAAYRRGIETVFAGLTPPEQ